MLLMLATSARTTIGAVFITLHFPHHAATVPSLVEDLTS